MEIIIFDHTNTIPIFIIFCNSYSVRCVLTEIGSFAGSEKKVVYYNEFHLYEYTQVNLEKIIFELHCSAYR